MILQQQRSICEQILKCCLPKPNNGLYKFASKFPFEGSKGDVYYTITDFSGKVLQTAKVRSDIEQINFSNYTAGTYFITVQENNQLIKSFKIMKN